VAWLSLLMCPVFQTGSDIPGEFFSIDTPELSSELASGTSRRQQNRILLVFIIDFKDFMCMSCLDSFLSFCRSIPDRCLEENAWGICVPDCKDKKSDTKKTAQIAEKKIRGFISANSIPFPIIIDHDRVFHSFAANGTALFVIDATGKTIMKCNFPIKMSDAQNIREILLKN
jgi:hypothetical protein